MRKRYRLKKRHTVSAMVIIIVVIATLIVMNTGYSLWSSKLDIYGHVTLDFVPPELEVTVPTTGTNQYTNNTFSSGLFGVTIMKHVSDVYSGNNLTTTLQVKANSLGITVVKSDVKTTFTIKNTSTDGYVYTNGTVTQMEVSNPSSSITNVSTNLVPQTLSSGDSATFTFSATVDRASVQSSTYYKYAITYDVNGVTRYFFYTIKVLPA